VLPRSIITTRECGMIMRLVASVCLSVCLSICDAPAVESPDLESSFLLYTYSFSVLRSRSRFKVKVKVTTARNFVMAPSSEYEYEL